MSHRKKRALGIVGILLGTAVLIAASTAWGDYIAIPRGTGAGLTGRVRFRELAANGTHSVDLKAPDSLAATTTYTLPNALPGGTDYSLVGNASGVTSWKNITGGGGGGLIWRETRTGSGVSNLDFTTCIDANYDNYKLFFQDIVTSGDGVKVGYQVSTDGGSTWDDTGSNYEATFLGSTGGGVGANGSTTNAMYLTNSVSNVSGYSFGGELTLFNPHSTSLSRLSKGEFLSRISSGDNRFFLWSFGGRWSNTTTAYNAVRVMISSGTFSGTVRCYAIAQS